MKKQKFTIETNDTSEAKNLLAVCGLSNLYDLFVDWQDEKVSDEALELAAAGIDFEAVLDILRMLRDLGGHLFSELIPREVPSFLDAVHGIMDELEKYEEGNPPE